MDDYLQMHVKPYRAGRDVLLAGGRDDHGVPRCLRALVTPFGDDGETFGASASNLLPVSDPSRCRRTVSLRHDWGVGPPERGGAARRRRGGGRAVRAASHSAGRQVAVVIHSAPTTPPPRRRCRPRPVDGADASAIIVRPTTAWTSRPCSTISSRWRGRSGISRVRLQHSVHDGQRHPSRAADAHRPAVGQRGRAQVLLDNLRRSGSTGNHAGHLRPVHRGRRDGPPRPARGASGVVSGNSSAVPDLLVRLYRLYRKGRRRMPRRPRRSSMVHRLGGRERGVVELQADPGVPRGARRRGASPLRSLPGRGRPALERRIRGWYGAGFWRRPNGESTSG